MWYCNIHNNTFITPSIFCPKQIVLLPHKDRAKCTTSCAAKGFFPQHEVYFPMSFSFFMKSFFKKHLAASWLQIFVHIYTFYTFYTFSALLIQILNANVYMYIICISFLLLLYLPLLWRHAYTNEMKTNLLTTVVPFSSGLACDEWCLRPSNLPKLVERCEEDSKTKRYGGHCHHLVSEV